MKNVVLYARSATREQAGKNGIANQLNALRDYCSKHNLNIVAEYTDAGERGMKLDRPGLNALFTDTDSRKFESVITCSFDRFARSVTSLITIVERLSQRNISIVCVREGIDSTSAIGKAFVSFMDLFVSWQDYARTQD